MPVSDLDSIIRTWAANQLKSAHGLGGASLPQTFDIDYSKVRFSTVESSASGAPLRNTATPSLVFTSNYDNHTDQVQDHTFLINRTTEATVTTKVTQGFSKNGNVGIKIPVPDTIANATGSFGTEVDIESEEENVVKHAIKWGLNTTVKAQPKRRTTAEMKIKVNESKFSFRATIQIRGRIVVRINDGSGFLPLCNDIATVIGDAGGSYEGMKIEGKKVIWDVTGQMNFRFGVSQDVQVKSEKM